MIDVSATVRGLLLQIAQGDVSARMVLSDFIGDKIDAAIADFCERLQAGIDANHRKRYPCLADPRIAIDLKRRALKYTRVVEYASSKPGASHHVVCFVERSTGLIWKANTWRGPVLNFPRGNVFDLPATIETTNVDSGAVMPPTAEGRNAIGIRGSR